MIITRTPFRISFFGGGTDYPARYKEHGGIVLSTSIDKYCYITVRRLHSLFPYRYRIRYTLQEEAFSVEDIKHPSVRECISFLNFQNQRIEMQHNADLPAMTGLGSSSSFTVGLLHALYALRGTPVDKRRLALDAIHIEQNIIGENVGSQDQTAAAFGGFNRIEFGGDEEIKVFPLAISQEKLNKLQDHCFLIFTGQSRIASEIAAEQIKIIPQKTRELEMMSQMVKEASLILTSNQDRFHDFGKLLHDSWQMKKALSSKITSPLIDETYKEALGAGAWGGKLIGAGGGGFMLIFAPPEQHKTIKERLKRLSAVSFKFENSGSAVIYKQLDEESNVVNLV